MLCASSSSSSQEFVLKIYDGWRKNKIDKIMKTINLCNLSNIGPFIYRRWHSYHSAVEMAFLSFIAPCITHKHAMFNFSKIRLICHKHEKKLIFFLCEPYFFPPYTQISLQGQLPNLAIFQACQQSFEPNHATLCALQPYTRKIH